MTVNRHAKGVRIEAVAVAELQRQGYTVHRTRRNVVRTRLGWRSTVNDVFGIIDIIAKKSDERTRWIQVTAGHAIGKKASELRQVPWALAHDSVEIWRWVSGGGKRIDGRTGQLRKTRFFQVYRMDDDFALVRQADRQIQVPRVADSEARNDQVADWSLDWTRPRAQ